jgi:hypothetical protein
VACIKVGDDSREGDVMEDRRRRNKSGTKILIRKAREPPCTILRCRYWASPGGVAGVEVGDDGREGDAVEEAPRAEHSEGDMLHQRVHAHNDVGLVLDKRLGHLPAIPVRSVNIKLGSQ